ncbi:MAG TPA: 2-amino-4-hydroxy-6-hydroxymethyldihydropteridine diphosphokinase [Actinomycetes bacterium]|nr:2-amino-4-hydroxy-6-hydroxymethyldihydropteridine diphosphokinase [Actinomycetes bacterium]
MTSAPVNHGTRAVLGLGSNLGERLEMLQGAVDALVDAPGIDVVAISPVYETDPLGGPAGQPPFLNAVIIVNTSMPVRTLLERCLAVEDAFERVRDVRWGPRTLDIDVITYGDTVSGAEDLTIPHPRAAERAFVLVPWHDIEPDGELIGYGSITDLLAKLDQSGVKRNSDLELTVPW